MPKNPVAVVTLESNPRRPTSWSRTFITVVVLILTAWCLFRADRMAVKRLNYVSGLSGWSVADDIIAKDPLEPKLLVPSRNDSALILMDQTRAMLDEGHIRLMRVNYENYPLGYDVRSASLGRWYLGLATRVVREWSGMGITSSMDLAALIEGPVALSVVLISGISLAVWLFGPLPASLFALYFSLLFPLSTAFIPGIPDGRHLSLAFDVWSLILFLPAFYIIKHRSRWLFAAGLVGGAGLWNSVSDQMPFLIGIVLGGIFATVADRIWRGRGTESNTGPLPWRAWAVGGAVSTLFACVIECFPRRLGLMDLTSIHPLYGLAWLGAGEVMAQATSPKDALRKRSKVVLAMALLVVAALPIAIWRNGQLGYLGYGDGDADLTRLAGSVSVSALNTQAWLSRDGLSPLALATFAPVSIIILAVWALGWRSGNRRTRAALALTFGPVLVTLLMALRSLQWWTEFDASLSALVLLTSAVFGNSLKRPIAVCAITCACVVPLVPAAVQLWSQAKAPITRPLSDEEVSGLVERDIARWLRVREPSMDALVLAPTHTTVALHHFGGFKGLGTLERDNREGIEAAVRIVNASTFDEAQNLVLERGVNYILIPSWDQQLSYFSGGVSGALKYTFLGHILSWNLPAWLRPVLYPLPHIRGDAPRSISLFQVVDESDFATAYARLAEYFLEAEKWEEADVVAHALEHYPGNLGALSVRAEIALARGQHEEVSRLVGFMMPLVSSPANRAMKWDRRVSLAIVLAQAHQLKAAKIEYIRCLSEIDSANLRSLSVAQLYHLHVLGRIWNIEISDPNLHLLSLDLLPPSVREQIER